MQAGDGRREGAAHGAEQQSSQRLRSRAAWRGAGPAPWFSCCSMRVFSWGVCHPAWETEREGADLQTTDSEYRKRVGAASDIRGPSRQAAETRRMCHSITQLSAGVTPRQGRDLKELTSPARAWSSAPWGKNDRLVPTSWCWIVSRANSCPFPLRHQFY